MLKEVMWMFFAVGSVQSAFRMTGAKFNEDDADFINRVALCTGRMADSMMDEYNRRFKRDMGRD